MADYSDLKVSPIAHKVLMSAAEAQYGESYRAASRAGHEAIIAWLVLRADDGVRRDALAAHGYDSIQGLVDDLADADGADGRFAGDDQFDPLAAVRTPRDLAADGGDD